ncbi:MAG: tyrosine-type recombinase/integrase [Thermoleophilia bacterium]
MRGHVRKRGQSWEVFLELGEQAVQRCPVCVDKRGRGKRYWAEHGRLDACPSCGGRLDDLMARRQIVPPERYRTKKEAQEHLTHELHAGMTGNFMEPALLTVKEYLEEHWLPNIRGQGLRMTTLVAYNLHVKQRIVPNIGPIRLQKLTTKDVDALYARLASEPGPRGRPLSSATCLAVHHVLHKALSKAVAWHLINHNPADGAEHPKVRRPQMNTWSGEEITLFLQLTADDRLHPLWRLLVTSGLRRGEALALRWSDVDLAAGRLSICRSRTQAGYQVVEVGTKTGRDRSVAIARSTVATLQRQAAQQAADAAAWQAAWSDSGHVFTREDGEPWHPDRVTKLFGRAVKTTGLRVIRLHDLRHSYATLALRAGVHPKVVQEALGHANIAMTMDTYSHAIPALQESAAELIAALIDGA